MDEVAPSGVGHRRSRRKLWCTFHRNLFADEPVLPLTMHSIAAVISQLKEGGYRSAADYAGMAKAQHFRRYEWTTRLARQQTVCLRSALRGIGPARQCGELPLIEVVAVLSTVLATDLTVPIGMRYCRGVLLLYAAGARGGHHAFSSVNVDPVRLVVTSCFRRPRRRSWLFLAGVRGPVCLL